MSRILDQAESLRQQAIEILMAERQLIDQKLAILSADGKPAEPSTREAASLRQVRKAGAQRQDL
jgi:hypothetical protein